ncbi:MAG: 50S ribosomal protein L11 methyltransferase [Rhodobacter sp.]|nr:50S ribosomal protein L11 methyltransferase [Rhodobacter sp.]MCY4240745.1 50S ribosomal protein L11 methyltransferase [Rhodobacter sp.]
MAGRTTFSAWTVVGGRNAAEALGGAMERLSPGPQGVCILQIEDGSDLWEVAGYFADRPEDVGLALLAASYATKPFLVSELSDTDWVAKVRRELPPVEAGRFFVHGSHDADRVPADRVALLVEAAMAFGTGHHATTLGCLYAMDRLACGGASPTSVIDVGCGTAVLAMAAASVWPVAPMATDIDEVAIEVAETNLRVNGLGNRVRCVLAADLRHAEIVARAPYDLVLANILKGPLIDLAPSISGLSPQGAHVILSGVLDDQACDVRSVYETLGFEETHRDSLSGWTTLTLRRVRFG